MGLGRMGSKGTIIKLAHGFRTHGGGMDSQWVALKVSVHYMLWVHHGADSDFLCINLVHALNVYINNRA